MKSHSCVVCTSSAHHLHVVRMSSAHRLHETSVPRLFQVKQQRTALLKTRDILSVLCTFIQTTETSALICLGDQSGSFAVTVLSQDSSMYIFDSYSRHGSGMPSANGTAVLMQFDNIQSTVSFICELAHSLAARLFHWTFWHSVPATSCDCDIFLGRSIPTIDILSEEEIMKLYSELVPIVPQQDKRRNYYRS